MVVKNVGNCGYFYTSKTILHRTHTFYPHIYQYLQQHMSQNYIFIFLYSPADSHLKVVADKNVIFHSRTVVIPGYPCSHLCPPLQSSSTINMFSVNTGAVLMQVTGGSSSPKQTGPFTFYDPLSTPRASVAPSFPKYLFLYRLVHVFGFEICVGSQRWFNKSCSHERSVAKGLD